MIDTPPSEFCGALRPANLNLRSRVLRMHAIGSCTNSRAHVDHSTKITNALTLFETKILVIALIAINLYGTVAQSKTCTCFMPQLTNVARQRVKAVIVQCQQYCQPSHEQFTESILYDRSG